MTIRTEVVLNETNGKWCVVKRWRKGPAAGVGDLLTTTADGETAFFDTEGDAEAAAKIAGWL